MKYAFAFQVALGIFKMIWAFTPYGSSRRTYHIVTGAVIATMGLALMHD